MLIVQVLVQELLVFYTVNYKNADVDKYVHIRNALNKLTEQEKLALDIKYH
jgi:hypothetical protein